jgi:pilus assembly protein Flp/PilA
MQMSIARHAKNFLRSEHGATAIEYGMIAALIVVVIVTGISALGQGISDTLYNKLSTLFAA